MGERFSHFFELSERDFGSISITTCNASLSAFRDAYAASTSKAAISLGISGSKDPIYGLCQQHASCILENSTEWAKANLGASNLILGLLPTILAVIAPSMTEIAGRVFYYEDPGEVLKTEYTRGDIRHPLAFGPWSTRSAALVGIAEFALAAGILLNTLVLVGYFLTLQSKNAVPSGGHKLDSRPASNEGIAPDNIGPSDKTGISSQVTATGYDAAPASSPPKGLLRRNIDRELTSCASHSHISRDTRIQDGQDRRLQIGILLNSIAGFLGFLHLIFSTVVFSALLFIVPLDAIGQVALRLLLSALTCRFIVMLELAGLRGRPAREESGGKQGKESLLGNAA
ncbi:hypothetical protein B0A48_14702 [Cryoendolithus antarcticus]|uniref:Uncharacterized protein n=1 Tax=Cryoendolithus antarcticus TaxID=1507870 RepID=A0A1V8SKT9_9PEZI|nr:hypothetical protein B0A48_14702 [Cryoendolithus antarcticus]